MQAITGFYTSPVKRAPISAKFGMTVSDDDVAASLRALILRPRIPANIHANNQQLDQITQALRSASIKPFAGPLPNCFRDGIYHAPDGYRGLQINGKRAILTHHVPGQYELYLETSDGWRLFRYDPEDHVLKLNITSVDVGDRSSIIERIYMLHDNLQYPDGGGQSRDPRDEGTQTAVKALGEQIRTLFEQGYRITL